MVVKRIMRYLKGNLDFKLCLIVKDIALRGFAMRIGREMQTTGDSPQGTCFSLALELFCGDAKKQPIIALSTMEVEYMAASHCMKEAVWLGQILAKWDTCKNDRIHYVQQSMMHRYHHSHTKHIDVQHHFIKEKLENQNICLKYYPTKDMIADVLAKPLANDRPQALTKAMDLEAFEHS